MQHQSARRRSTGAKSAPKCFIDVRRCRPSRGRTSRFRIADAARPRPVDRRARAGPRHFIRRRLALAGGGARADRRGGRGAGDGGSGPAPPATGAATIVPADALAYVSLSTDPARPAVSAARKLAARFPDWPLLRTAALNRLGALVGAGGAADFATGVRPWLGKEAALALIAGPNGTTQSLVVLDVARRARAQAFVRSAGASPAGSLSTAPAPRLPVGERARVRRPLPGGRLRCGRPRRARRRSRPGAGARAQRGLRASGGGRAGRSRARRLPACPRGSRPARLARRRGRCDRTAARRAGGDRHRDLTLADAVRRAGDRASRPQLRGEVGQRLHADAAVGSSHRLVADARRRTASIAPHRICSPRWPQVASRATSGRCCAAWAPRSPPQGVSLRNVVSLFDGETAVAIAPGSDSGAADRRPGPQPGGRPHRAGRARGTRDRAVLAGGLGGRAGSRAGRPRRWAARPCTRSGSDPGSSSTTPCSTGLVVVSTSVPAIDEVAQRSRSLAADARVQGGAAGSARAAHVASLWRLQPHFCNSASRRV